MPENHPASPHASDAREHRRTVEHHQARDDAGTQHADDEHDSRPTHTSAHALPERADSLFSAHAGLTESPGDDDAARVIPMVEVQPVTRCTGADVRHALWTRELDPSLILTDCVLRYIESHMLYRDSRKSLSMRGSSGGGLRNTGDAARLHGLGGGGGSGNSSSSSSGAMVGGEVTIIILRTRRVTIFITVAAAAVCPVIMALIRIGPRGVRVRARPAPPRPMGWGCASGGRHPGRVVDTAVMP